MHLLTAICAILGGLLVSAAGHCNLVPAPDQSHTYPNIPLKGESPGVVFNAAAGCDVGTWQFGRSHVFPRPDEHSFSVWSFHVVNPANANETILARFVMGTNDAYEYLGPGSGYLAILIDVQFADGHQYNSVIYGAHATVVTIDTFGWGTNSVWGATGWNSTRDGKHVDLFHNLGHPLGLSGSMVLKSIAPPRYPCSSNLTLPSSLEIVPCLGQTNQMPDASTTVDFTLIDANPSLTRHLKFANGVGFHEQTWSNAHLRAVAPTWRRGNARLHVIGDKTGANHSVVWWEGTGPNHRVHSTAYASMDGTIVKEGCDWNRESQLLKVEAHTWGTVVDIKVAEEMHLLLHIQKVSSAERRETGAKPLKYVRMTGTVKATLGAETKLEGVAWTEEGDFGPEPWKHEGKAFGNRVVLGEF
ncbi:hypothetical protein CC86DRAFT_456467 [Ophiobolus disseminans]|uniref:AttH domain-containing protein n=1 Tax=Ophiobolus disseminans TaxID=1469910 RepID=A0A6A6ZVZ2_9PLEO|nr:hypothetical protein CC86DRAFT_456467 [Ophiobolus disseminans]